MDVRRRPPKSIIPVQRALPGHELARLASALLALPDHALVALATLVCTHGSTFRRAGTHMLVHSDGTLVGELSGGCPQRDIVLRASEALASGQARVVSYNAQNGLDVLLETGCGGELDVLVEPVAAKQGHILGRALLAALDCREPFLLATWFATDGSTHRPRRWLRSGAEILLDELGTGAEAAAVRAAVKAVDAVPPGTRELATGHGAAAVLFEPLQAPPSLIAIGANPTARALLQMARWVGWRSTLVDADPQRLATFEDLAGVERIAAVAQDVDRLIPDARTAVVVMTHNLEQDQAWLRALANQPLAYLGALGSRERASQMRATLPPGAPLLYAPAGLDVGSDTPAEIALAVAAEILAVLHDRSGQPLRAGELPIHP